jgi:hypothetical protein
MQYILLAGGFGKSPYLLKRIKESFEKKLGILVIRPMNP